jgi:ketosteroid isomerase-like protein
MYSLVADGGKGTIIQNSQLQTRQEALDASKSAFNGLKKIEYKFDQQYVKVISPDTAIFTGKGQSITTTDADNTYTKDFAVTCVFVLKDKEWKIIHGHYSSPSM